MHTEHDPGLNRERGGAAVWRDKRVSVSGAKTKTAQQVFRINTRQTHGALCPFPETLKLLLIIAA